MVNVAVFERVKTLCDERKISINDLEHSLGYSKNTLYRLKTQNPGSDKLQAIADYFNVSTDYLLGRTEEAYVPEWATAKDIRDFKKMLEEETPVMFDGVPLNDEARQRVMDVLTGLFWEAKEMNKKTYGRKNTKNDTSDDNENN